jgi:type IV pilus assembly protein PilA
MMVYKIMNRRKRRGFSLIELLIVIAIILIIITVALPKLNHARMYAQETAALNAIRTLHTVQVQYSSTYGRYATSLAELGPPASGQPSASAADLIDGTLAAGEKSGYRFTLTGTPGGYVINGNPIAFNSTGSRTFFSDQTMVVRENDGPEPATINSKEIR